MSRLLHLLLDRMRLLREDAVAVAQVVEAAFQGRSELDDEGLDKDLRQVFYDLQDQRILGVRREERHEDGLERRHYLWSIAGDVGEEPASPFKEPFERLYGELGSEAWDRRRRD